MILEIITFYKLCLLQKKVLSKRAKIHLLASKNTNNIHFDYDKSRINIKMRTIIRYHMI